MYRKRIKVKESCNNHSKQKNAKCVQDTNDEDNIEKSIDFAPFPFGEDTHSAKAENDRRILLGIFPEEVWLLVFDKADSDDDLESLSNSSLILRHFLLPRREHFLLSKVLGIFIGGIYDETSQNLNSRGNYNPRLTRDPPYFFPTQFYVESRDPSIFQKWTGLRLNLRLVSRSWCRAIDAFHDNHPFHFKLQARPDGLFENRLRRLIVTTFSDGFRQRTLTPSFLPHFHNSHGEDAKRNPFFGRNVVLMYESSNGTQAIDFDQISRNILAKYGHHIWYCTIHVSGEPPSFFWENLRTSSYSRLKEWLQLMPNLKVFRLKFLGRALVPEELTQLKQEIDSGGELPHLPNLQFLNIVNMPYPSFKKLVSANSHVSTLLWYVDPERTSPEEHHNICSIGPLPNLKAASLQIFSERDFQNIAECPQAKWPLTKLVLEFEEGAFLKWQRIFNTLQEKWGNTLTHLELSLPAAKDDDTKSRIEREAPSYWFNLPNLKTLKLTMHNLACLDFLLPMKESLSTLNLQVNLQIPSFKNKREMRETLEKVEKGNIIELLGCAMRPLKSNIWARFRKLNWVHFCIEGSFITEWEELVNWSYNREDWKMNKTL